MKRPVKLPRLPASGTVLHGDCVELMFALPENSVDAIVTDPPYEIGFMGKTWDQRGVAFAPATWREALRVLKPGGHLLAFGGTRTFHRLTCAIEDAGFEIRDCLMWLYGSGFPKSLDVSKAIDKAAGATREVTGVDRGKAQRGAAPSSRYEKDAERGWERPNGRYNVFNQTGEMTAPATDDARCWQGWGTALKPAWEPIVLARKPLGEANVAANVLRHGTGALNIDASRIGFANEADRASALPGSLPGPHAGFDGQAFANRDRSSATPEEKQSPLGRWPANVLLAHTDECREIGTRRVKTGTAYEPDGVRKPRQVYSSTNHLGRTVTFGDADGMETIGAWDCSPECPVRRLDEQVPDAGASAPVVGDEPSLCTTGDRAYGRRERVPGTFYADKGGASRFFYCAKASRSDRTMSGRVENKHPTVKPRKLMAYLCALITPRGGLILDPFTGSGSTLLGALDGGFDVIGIERDEESAETARQRVALWEAVGS